MRFSKLMPWKDEIAFPIKAEPCPATGRIALSPYKRKEVVGIPLHHDLRTILQCFPQMCRLDFITSCEICNRAGKFQDAMIGTRG